MEKKSRKSERKAGGKSDGWALDCAVHVVYVYSGRRITWEGVTFFSPAAGQHATSALCVDGYYYHFTIYYTTTIEEELGP